MEMKMVFHILQRADHIIGSRFYILESMDLIVGQHDGLSTVIHIYDRELAYAFAVSLMEPVNTGVTFFKFIYTTS
jgi:hypothetical protein